MKTSVIDVHDMLSVLSVDDVELRIGEVPGVESSTVNFAAGSATIRYDETRLEVADIKATVRQRAYESAAPDAALASDGYEGHRAAGAAPASPALDVPKTPSPGPATTSTASAGTAQQDIVVPSAAPSATVAATPIPPVAVPTAASEPMSAAPEPGADAAPEGDEQPDKATPDKS